MSDIPLKLGYNLSRHNIPGTLNRLIDQVADIYGECHPNLVSVYVIGSVVLGEWQKGLSDLDVIGVSSNATEDDDNDRRSSMLDELSRASEEISFIDNSVLDKSELTSDKKESRLYVAGQASKIALTGVCVRGVPQDFSEFLPTVNELAFGRAGRVEALMEKYRAGIFIKAFERDNRLITRSCGKAAMRALSSGAILRGASYHPSPFRVEDDVRVHLPEANDLAKRALGNIVNPDRLYHRAIHQTYEALELFYDLFGKIDEVA
jgi:hypothetical protein